MEMRLSMKEDKLRIVGYKLTESLMKIVLLLLTIMAKTISLIQTPLICPICSD